MTEKCELPMMGVVGVTTGKIDFNNLDIGNLSATRTEGKYLAK
jgi:hypothetical protein